MAYKTIVAPTTEPVTLAEAKAHLRVDTATDDTLITALIKTAREQAEHLTGRAIGVQTIELQLDDFPGDAIELPRPPLVSVTSVQYVDSAGVLQTVAGSNFAIDSTSEPSWILPAYGFDWPHSRVIGNAMTVIYQAGYADCPASLKSWILLAVGSMYEHREADSTNPPVPVLFVAHLLDPFKIWEI